MWLGGVGVMSVGAGVLALAGGIWGFGQLGTPQMQTMSEEVDGFGALVRGTLALLGILSLLLFVGGVCVLRRRRIGWWASLSYSILAILGQAASSCAFLAHFNDATTEWFQRQYRFTASVPASWDTIQLVRIVLVLYAIVLLVLVLLPAVRRSFADVEPSA